jgi:His-Xaa-Ser system protein HxsD
MPNFGPVNEECRRWEVEIDLAAYSLEAISKSLYRLTDRCYARLKTKSDSVAVVELQAKTADDNLEVLQGEFFNELLDQHLRLVIATETQHIRDIVMMHALSRTALVRPDLECEVSDDMEEVASCSCKHPADTTKISA